ncbi:MAG: ATP-dependent Clp protease adaptor ClpS [Treponema sp.]|nr:ATP-dependent Clp protease adaptor ClpS [Treponema sp.]
MDSNLSFYKENKRYNDAITYLKKEQGKNPNNAQIKADLGYFYDINGCKKAAIKVYSEAIKLDPNLPIVRHNRGWVNLRFGRMNDALADFNAAISLGLKDYRTFEGRGLCHKSLGLLDLAVNDFDKAIELNKASVELIINRAHLYFRLKKYEQAKEDLYMSLGLKYSNFDPTDYVSIFHRSNLEEGKETGNMIIKAGFNIEIEKNDDMFVIMPCTSTINRTILPLINFDIKKDVLLHLQKYKDCYAFKAEPDIENTINKTDSQYLDSINIDKDKLRFYLSLDNVKCFALYKDKKLVAWEIGIINDGGKIYSSIIRFYDPAEQLTGKIRINFLVEHLKSIGVTLIDFGSSKDKWNNLFSFGAENIDAHTYLQLFKELSSSPKPIFYIGSGKIKENITGRYFMVLLNNDNTTQDFVVDLLMELFNFDLHKATMLMLETHRNGKGVIGTTDAKMAVPLVQYIQKTAKDNGHTLICLLEEV